MEYIRKPSGHIFHSYIYFLQVVPQCHSENITRLGLHSILTSDIILHRSVFLSLFTVVFEFCVSSNLVFLPGTS